MDNEVAEEDVIILIHTANIAPVVEVEDSLLTFSGTAWAENCNAN